MANSAQLRIGPILLLVCAAVLLTLLPRHEGAYAEEPGFDASAAVRATVRQLESEQFFSKPLDDELSAQWLRSFLALLDPRRMYFLDRDLAHFRRSERELDDAARLGEFPLAIRIREVYRERTAEASSYAERFLEAESSFAPADRFPDRFDSYAANRAELQERWRRRIHLELLIEKAHNRPLAEVKDQLRGRYRRIARQAQEMNDERLCGVFLNALLRVYDPHAEFFTPTELGLYGLPGRIRTYDLALSFGNSSGEFVITAVPPPGNLTGSPQRADLVGWRLIAIRRVQGPVVDVVEMYRPDFLELIWMSDGPLGDDREVILELLHPVTRQRMTLTWPRHASF